MADVETLGHAAVVTAQRIEYVACSYAFGDDRHAKIVTKIDDATYDQLICLIALHGQYKGFVDLEFADGQILQLSQTRMAAAEIIDGDRDAHRM